MAAILNRLEIDVMQSNELVDAISFTMKYNLPSIVVSNCLVGDAIRLRGRHKGRFKILTVIDHPKGETRGLLKFRGLLADALEADGYEIMLYPYTESNHVKAEASALIEFVINRFDRESEVRFVFNSLTTPIEHVKIICNGLVGIRTPAMIRTDHQLKLQVGKANPLLHNNIISNILPIIRIPIKLSGNINNIKTINECQDASRYAVNLLQATNIAKEFFSTPIANGVVE